MNTDNMCAVLGLRYVRYTGDDGRVRFFLHELGFETGLLFFRKEEMSEELVAFMAVRDADRDASLVSWGGRRGHRVLSTTTKEQREERSRNRDRLARMKEVSAAGETLPKVEV